MRRLALLTAALLAAQPGIASAQGTPCLSTGEFAAVTQFALPSAIEGATVRCEPSLPPGAFLRGDGARAMSARYAEASRQSWPEAKAALLRVGGVGGKGTEGALLAALPDASLQQVLDGVIQGVVVAKLTTDRCGTVDRLLALLGPLPATNTSGVVAIVVGLVTEKKNGKLGPITICEN
jgi:hypothetical protein